MSVDVVIIDSGGANLASLQPSRSSGWARARRSAPTGRRSPPRRACCCRAWARRANAMQRLRARGHRSIAADACASRCSASASACSCCSSAPQEGDDRDCLGHPARQRAAAEPAPGLPGAAHGLEHARPRVATTRCWRASRADEHGSISCTAIAAKAECGHDSPARTTARRWPPSCDRENFRGVQFHPERSSDSPAQAAGQLPEALTLMPPMLIPSIDLRGGHCVRLLRGDFAAETRYDLEPHELLGALSRPRRDLAAHRRPGRRARRPAREPRVCCCARQPARRQPAGRRRRACAGRRRRPAAQRRRPRGVGSAAVEEPAAVAGGSRSSAPSGSAWRFDVRADAARHAAGADARLDPGDARCRCGTRSRAFCRRPASTCCAPTSIATARWAGLPSRCTPKRVRRFPQIRWQASGGVRDARRPRRAARHRRRGGGQRQGAARGAHRRRRLRPFLAG
jgi:hypothetical protein